MSKQTLKNIKKKPSSGEPELSKKTKKRILILLWLAILSPILFTYLMIWATPESELPSLEQLENPRSDEATLVYDANGEILGSYYVSNRTKVSFNELSPYLVDALVSTEDERFFEHSGIDGEALTRAVGGAAIGRNKGGASTITQQLAKMMFHDRPKSKWKRIKQKFAEWIIAVRLEKNYTKEEIMAMYFNQFDFLNTAVGIYAASRVYFNKEPKDLKIEEAAMLVGMAKNPSIFNPVRQPDTTLHRRMIVMHQMVKNNKLTQAEYDSLRVLPLGLDFNPETHTTGLAPYFREHVRLEASAILKKKNILNEFGEPINLYTDGLKIYTTLDANMQKYAEWAVEEYLSTSLQPSFNKNIAKYKNTPFANSIPKSTINNSYSRAVKNSDRYKKLKKQGATQAEIDKSFATKIEMTVFSWTEKNHKKTVEMSPMDSIKYYKKLLRAGLISMDPNTGFVKAWVGGPDYKFFKYDHAYNAKRQVGSTMKPFVYSAAIQDNILSNDPKKSPCKEYPNIKYCVDIPYGAETKQWCPGGEKDYDGLPTPVYFALANSMNNITAKIIDESGGTNSRVVDYFKEMGMNNSTILPVASLGLGVCDLSVLEMTSAHCIFSNKGYYIEPITIARIEDKNGKVLYEAQPKIKQIISEEVAFEMIKMMKGVTGVKRPVDGKMGGTARRLHSNKPYAFKGIMAGKTGTTQDNSDGWFMGHTPDLVTGVWVGAEDRGVHFSTTDLGQGANTALPIWGYYMSKVYADKKIKISHGDFEPPYPGYSTTIECEKNNVGDPDTWGF